MIRVHTYDMSLTREDFLRILPAAVGDETYQIEGGNFLHTEAGRCWRITVEPLAPLALGALSLERQLVEIQFTDYQDQDAQAFLDRFELHFRRGGG